VCGINGIFAYQTAASAPARTELIATREHMAARGPDGAGEWWSDDRRCAFGFRRLAIQDLSDRASQPMANPAGDQVIVFNGEIYNFPQLRAELERDGRRFCTTSDTEVLLQLYATHGPEMVHRLRGMYAFAIWDEARRGLFLARDPYGIKPLYTANDGWTFRFASQVKALLAGGGISRDPEPAGIVGFHLFGSVPEPFTLYRDIRALPAGHIQWVDAAGPREPRPYANIAQILAEGTRTMTNPADLNDKLRAAVLESVRAHLIADVEVGVFLSAGIDSGAILGLMRDASPQKIRAITLAYDEFTGTGEDESPLAAEAAALYGADHTIRRVSHREFREDLPAILAAMDQPSIDGVNTWFVSKAAAEAGLKVALSGLGGDELLAGYPSFRHIPIWARWLRLTSVPGLGNVARALGALVAPTLCRQYPKAFGVLEVGGGYCGAYLLRRGLFLPAELKQYLDQDLLRSGLARLGLLPRLNESLTPDPNSATGRVCALESTQYMRNQLLRDTDWAGMAHSIEVRTPLVDVELLAALAPYEPTMSLGVGKRALSVAPSTPLPRQTVERVKTGFGVPGWYFTTQDEQAISTTKGIASRARARDVFRAFGDRVNRRAILPGAA
jgi:asparagine synthase (glutamine-hydrolysing)